LASLELGHSVVGVVAVVATTVNGSCDGGWQSYMGYEYCFWTVEENHATARGICHGFGAELASITSDEECDFVAAGMSVNFRDKI